MALKRSRSKDARRHEKIKSLEKRPIKKKPAVQKQKCVTGDAKAAEGDDHEYSLEKVVAVGWDELKMVFTLKWKNYSSRDNTTEKLSYLQSLQEPYKYLTEVNTNLESECFKIFTGLHKEGFRYHCSDDRFFFCVKKEQLINTPYCKPYLRIFNSFAHRTKLLRDYNNRLRKVEGSIMFKVVNKVDLAMPPPFFGVDILDHDNSSDDQLPSVIQKREMSIVRHQSAWTLRADSVVANGSTLFQIEGEKCDWKLAFDQMKEMGELLAFAHFVCVGGDTEDEFTLDRRGVFDAVSCISHSCDPNCKMVWDKETDQVTVVAKRDIKRGDLISLDYFSESKVIKKKEDLVMRIDSDRDCVECTCWSDNCRIILWTEKLIDPMYFDYLKEDKLKHIKYGYFYKGVRFGMD